MWIIYWVIWTSFIRQSFGTYGGSDAVAAGADAVGDADAAEDALNATTVEELPQSQEVAQSPNKISGESKLETLKGSFEYPEDISGTQNMIGKIPEDISKKPIKKIPYETQSLKELSASQNHTLQRIKEALTDIYITWPLGIVKYFFDIDSYGGQANKILVNRVKNGMSKIEAASCLKFMALDSRPQYLANEWYLYISKPANKKLSCQHFFEKTPGNITDYGVIYVYFGLNCLSGSQIMHTLMHAIGFFDEITHSRRDEYVRVQWKNIRAENIPLFRQDNRYQNAENYEFDPTSIMMFHERAFTNNGKVTIKSVVPGMAIKPSDDLSRLDKIKLRHMFQNECNKRKVSDMAQTCKNGFSNTNKRTHVKLRKNVIKQKH